MFCIVERSDLFFDQMPCVAIQQRFSFIRFGLLGFLFIMFCLCCWPVEVMCVLSSAHMSISNPRLSTQYLSIMMIAFHHLLVCLLIFCTCVDGVGY